MGEVLQRIAGKRSVCLGLDDTTPGAPQALHGFDRHGQHRRVSLALGSSHCGTQLILAWYEAARLDPPTYGIRWLVEMRCRPGKRSLLLRSYTDQDQGARHNPHAGVQGHGEDGVTPRDYIVFYWCEKDDTRSRSLRQRLLWARGQGGRAEE
jgi:hypothetical protein